MKYVVTDSSKLKNYYFWIDKVNTRNYICKIMYLILSKQKLNKNVLVDISEPHFFQRRRFTCGGSRWLTRPISRRSDPPGWPKVSPARNTNWAFLWTRTSGSFSKSTKRVGNMLAAVHRPLWLDGNRLQVTTASTTTRKTGNYWFINWWTIPRPSPS